VYQLKAQNLSKSFNNKSIFNNIDFELKSGQSLVITGHNGSGKTTLVRIISGLLSPTKGTIDYYQQSIKIDNKNHYELIGLVGPYLQMYNVLTAWENLIFFSRIRQIKPNPIKLKELMKSLGIANRELDQVKSYSSGMLQRLKYVVALLHEPPVLILDEPTSNLDETGCQIVYDIMEKQRKNKILILATNDPREIQFGEKRIDLTV
jgi:heme exporter protein A